MHNTLRKLISIGLSVFSMASCADTALLTVEAGMGPNPALPAPRPSFIPTVHIAEAVGWPKGGKPVAAPGLAVNAYAGGFDHPRTLHVLPNGDVLVAETNSPAKEDGGGIRGWFMKKVMQRAGAGVPSANRITLVRDADGDGVAEIRSVFLEGLNSPFGMALVGNTLYVANTDAVVKFPYRTGELKITAAGVKVADLPAGKINHHWTKDMVASRDGSKLYVSVGSNSNVGENGMENEVRRAAILEIDTVSGQSRVFASGLRNPNGLTLEPQTGALWAAVNERDEIGSDLVPDYMTSIKDGGFYGWPYSYFGRNIDDRIKPPRPDLVATALTPDYALGPHTASLGLTFYQARLLPERYAGGAFVGQHGSWNRKPRSGYKVIHVPFRNGKPAGAATDVLTGFLDAEGKALGRPVGVTVDTRGALLVADDVGNVVWRVTPAASAPASPSSQTPAPR